MYANIFLHALGTTDNFSFSTGQFDNTNDGTGTETDPRAEIDHSISSPESFTSKIKYNPDNQP